MSGIARRLARLEAKRGAARPLECWTVYDTDDEGRPADEAALAAAKAKAEAEGRRILVIRVVYEDDDPEHAEAPGAPPYLKRL